ncbi:MAG: DUF2321 domain-containing protein [Vampirovibrio sp.]|nr:DUF2321 domain-containing protein [Vampirovibrio sp.]
MKFYRAFYAFYQSLLDNQCHHPQYRPSRQDGHCPDCGYKVHTVWTIIRCQTCGSKRIPKKCMDGQIRPVHKHCSHCGSVEFHLSKKTKIDAYELVYAISSKEIDYSEPRRLVDPPPQWPGPQSPKSPYPSYHYPRIFEGEVVRKQQFIRPKSRA